MKKNVTEELLTLGALLRLPYERLVARTYAELAANGFEDIRPAHSVIFRHILPTGSRLTELAERAQMTKQSMAYLVDYLGTHGYAEMLPDPQDGRAKLVRLTARGVAFQEAAIVTSQRIESDLAGKLGEESMAQLRLLLEQVAENMELSGEDSPKSGLRLPSM